MELNDTPKPVVQHSCLNMERYFVIQSPAFDAT